MSENIDIDRYYVYSYTEFQFQIRYLYFEAVIVTAPEKQL